MTKFHSEFHLELNPAYVVVTSQSEILGFWQITGAEKKPSQVDLNLHHDHHGS